MPDQNKDELLTALLNKLVSILNGSDDTVAKSPDNYIAWCLPGIPFQPEDLQFAVKGISGKNGDETKELVQNAAEFSRVVNAIPSSNVVNTRSTFEQNNKTLWDIYQNVLQFSEVSNTELTDKQKQKIDKFRKLFTVTKTVTDIVTDEQKEVVEDGPMIKAYNECMAAYIDAALEYNNKRLSALNGDDRQSVQDFTLNASNYRQRVKSAMNDWISKGYKEDVEEITAFMRQIAEKNLTLLKTELQDKLEKGKMTDPNSGSDFYLSSFYPGNFVNTNKGWSKFSFYAFTKDTYSKDTHSSTSGSFGASWGLWSGSGGASSTEDTSLGQMDATDFEMEFSVVQVPIGRGWFSPDFLMNKAWRWKEKTGMDMLSDGSNPAHGQLIAYPTTAIFVKDVKMKSSKMHDFAETVSKSLSAGGSVGWGPFSIGVNHNSSSKETTTKFSLDGDTFTIEGMQLIAFKCFSLPKSPDPSPDITEWI